jgi:hypothetical protein
MDLDELEDGQFRVDVTRAKAVVEGQEPSFWDLELHVPGRVFVGRWDDVPNGSADVIDFHPATPPPWLVEELLTP